MKRKITQTIYERGEKAYLVSYDGREITIHRDEIKINNDTIKPIDKLYLENVVHVPSAIVDKPGMVYDDLYEFYKENILLSDTNLTLATAYTWYTWFYDRVETAPYLYLNGQYGSGKTRLKDLIAHTAFNSTDLGTSVTPANIFRMQNEIRGTLFIDEFEPDNQNELRVFSQILNGGYKKDAIVFRSENRRNTQFCPTPYNVYGPKILCSTKLPSLNKALLSRCFLINMERVSTSKLKQHNIALDFSDEQKANALHIRNRMLRARFDLYEHVPHNNIPGGLLSEFPRDAQLLKSILSVQIPKYVERIAEAIIHSTYEGKRNEYYDLTLFVAESILDKLKVLETEGKILPQDISLKNICEDIGEKYGYHFKSKKITPVISELGLEKVRTANGMVVRVKSGDEINTLSELQNKKAA